MSLEAPPPDVFEDTKALHKTRVTTMGRKQFKKFEEEAHKYMKMLDDYKQFDGFVRARSEYKLWDLIHTFADYLDPAWQTYANAWRTPWYFTFGDEYLKRMLKLRLLLRANVGDFNQMLDDERHRRDGLSYTRRVFT